MVLKIKLTIDGKKIRKLIEKKTKASIIETGLLDEAAQLVIDKIRSSNFKPLKDSTVKWRKKIAQTNPTHPKYSANKSNSTLSGEFIDSIVADINKTQMEVIIKPTGDHPGYFTVKGSVTPKKAVSNQDILKRQNELGRKILKLSAQTKKEIIKLIKKRIREEFK